MLKAGWTLGQYGKMDASRQKPSLKTDLYLVPPRLLCLLPVWK